MIAKTKKRQKSFILNSRGSKYKEKFCYATAFRQWKQVFWLISDLVVSGKYHWSLLKIRAKPCSPNYYRKIQQTGKLTFDKISDLLIWNATITWP